MEKMCKDCQKNKVLDPWFTVCRECMVEKNGICPKCSYPLDAMKLCLMCLS